MGHLESRTPLGLLGRQGFPRTAPGNHISARAARTHFQRSKRRRRQSGVARSSVRVGHIAERTRFGGFQRLIESWEQLDSVDLREVFLQRVPILKSCPRFLRGRFRFSFGVALRERHRAKLEGGPGCCRRFRTGKVVEFVDCSATAKHRANRLDRASW